MSTHEYTYAQLNLTLLSDFEETENLYIYTTLTPIQEIGTSDFVYFRGKNFLSYAY